MGDGASNTSLFRIDNVDNLIDVAAAMNLQLNSVGRYMFLILDPDTVAQCGKQAVHSPGNTNDRIVSSWHWEVQAMSGRELAALVGAVYPRVCGGLQIESTDSEGTFAVEQTVVAARLLDWQTSGRTKLKAELEKSAEKLVNKH